MTKWADIVSEAGPYIAWGPGFKIFEKYWTVSEL